MVEANTLKQKSSSEARRELIREEVEVAGVEQDPQLRQAPGEVVDRNNTQLRESSMISTLAATTLHGPTAAVPRTSNSTRPSTTSRRLLT